MKQLLLLRHAKSSWDDPDLADHDRPLAPRGRRASKLIADHLRREQIRPALVLSSSSRRTRETLERISPGLSEEADVLVEPELYTARWDALLDRLHEVRDDAQSVLLIGHNPAIQDLALSLARGGPEIGRVGRKFPTAALATLTFEGSWRQLAPQGAELVAFVKPKELRSS